MKMLNFLVVAALFFCLPVQAEEGEKTAQDLGYRFKWNAKARTGKCVNSQGQTGLNPHFVGVCGDMRGMALQGMNLNGKNLSGSNLDGLNLTGVQMNGSNMRGVSANGTNFTKAKLNGVSFYAASLSGAILNRTELNGANLNWANLSGSRIEHAQLHGTQMVGTNLSGTKVRAKMDTANLKRAVMSVGTLLPFDQSVAESRGMVPFNKVNYAKSLPEKRLNEVREPASEDGFE